MNAHIPTRSIAKAGLAEHIAKNDRKHFLTAGNQWLHWSGSKLTSKRSEAWQGTIDQARACRRTFSAAAGCRAIPVNAITPTLMAQED